MSKMSQISMAVDEVCDEYGYNGPAEFDFEIVEDLSVKLGLDIDQLCSILNISAINLPVSTCLL